MVDNTPTHRRTQISPNIMCTVETFLFTLSGERECLRFENAKIICERESGGRKHERRFAGERESVTEASEKKSLRTFD